MTRHPYKKSLVICTALVAALSAATLGAQATPGDVWHYATGSHGECLGFWNVIDASGCTYSIGADAFGAGPNLCGHVAPTTNWPVNTDLYVWRIFVVPATATQAVFSWAVDNDMDLYIDGELEARDRNSNCGTSGSTVVSVSPGPHKIAVHAADYGSQSYFDLDVTFR